MRSCSKLFKFFPNSEPFFASNFLIGLFFDICEYLRFFLGTLSMTVWLEVFRFFRSCLGICVVYDSQESGCHLAMNMRFLVLISIVYRRAFPSFFVSKSTVNNLKGALLILLPYIIGFLQLFCYYSTFLTFQIFDWALRCSVAVRHKLGFSSEMGLNGKKAGSFQKLYMYCNNQAAAKRKAIRQWKGNYHFIIFITFLLHSSWLFTGKKIFFHVWNWYVYIYVFLELNTDCVQVLDSWSFFPIKVSNI